MGQLKQKDNICIHSYRGLSVPPCHGRMLTAWVKYTRKKRTYLLEAPGAAGVHSQTLLTCASSSGRANIWGWNQKTRQGFFKLFRHFLLFILTILEDFRRRWLVTHHVDMLYLMIRVMKRILKHGVAYIYYRVVLKVWRTFNTHYYFI